MALSRPTCGYGLETCPWQSASCLFVDGRKIRSSNPDKGVKILQSANLTTMTMTRTVVALTAAREIVAPSAPQILGVGTACIGSAAGGNVVHDDDDDGRPWGGPPLFVATTNKAT